MLVVLVAIIAFVSGMYMALVLVGVSAFSETAGPLSSCYGLISVVAASVLSSSLSNVGYTATADLAVVLPEVAPVETLFGPFCLPSISLSSSVQCLMQLNSFV